MLAFTGFSSSPIEGIAKQRVSEAAFAAIMNWCFASALRSSTDLSRIPPISFLSCSVSTQPVFQGMGKFDSVTS